MFLCALGASPSLLLSTMDSQLEAVRQDVRSVKDKIVKIEQDLATNDKEKERFMYDLLLGLNNQLDGLNNQLGGLNNQLSGLQEKENILLRSQAPSKPCLQLVHTGSPVFKSCCIPFSESWYRCWSSGELYYFVPHTPLWYNVAVCKGIQLVCTADLWKFSP